MRAVTTIATLALLTAFGAACGDEEGSTAAPVLSNLKAPDTFTRGALSYGTVGVGILSLRFAQSGR